MSKIILCCILGNEERIITRLLDSVIEWVDAVCLCVNGSDKTEEIVKEYLGKTKVKHSVVRHVWDNFAKNRSLSLEATRDLANSLEFPSGATYALTLDADMIWMPKKGFKEEKKNLTQHCYDVYQVNRRTHNRYPNVRLMRLDLKWASYTFTHEYWDDETICVQHGDVAHAWIDDVDDGGSKGDKYERDRRLLKRGLVEDDARRKSRYYYYLGQTDCGWGNSLRKEIEKMNAEISKTEKELTKIWEQDPTEETEKQQKEVTEKITSLKRTREEKQVLQTELWDESIEMFKNRIEAGGYPGEVWAAYYHIGRMNKKRKLLPEAAHWFLLSINHLPVRAESYFRLAQAYFKAGHHKVGFEIAMKGAELPFPESERHMVEWRIYSYRLLFLIQKASFQACRSDAGIAATTEIILRRDIEDYRRGWAVRDRNRWHLQPLKDHQNPLKVIISFGEEAELVPLAGMTLIRGQKTFIIATPVHSLRLKPSFKEVTINKVTKLRHNLPDLEDVRIFGDANQVWWLGASGADLVAGTITGAEMSKKLVIPYKKHALPFFNVESELCLLISLDPISIYNVQTKKTTTIDLDYNFSLSKPVAGPLLYPLLLNGKKVYGKLIVVRDEYDCDDGKTYASHMFLWFDNDFRLQKMSVPFYFLDKGPEKCTCLFSDENSNPCVAITDINGEGRILRYGQVFMELLMRLPPTFLKRRLEW